MLSSAEISALPLGSFPVKYSKGSRARRMPRALQQFDDGVDVYRGFGRRLLHKHDRKTRQLCRQAQRALMLALAGCGDPVLQSVCIQAVEPAPDASRLRVIVRP